MATVVVTADRTLDRRSATSCPPPRRRPAPRAAPQFNGLLSVGVVSTDDQTGTTTSRTRYAGTPDRFFFTVPQASLSTNLDLGHGVGVFAQFDYGPDRPSATGTPSLPRQTG